MPIVPAFGFGVKGKSSNVTAQSRINLYAETFGGNTDDKTQMALYTRPGAVQLNPVITSVGIPTTPVGPALGVMDGIPGYGFSGTPGIEFMLAAYQGGWIKWTGLSTAAIVTSTGAPAPTTSAVSMAFNGQYGFAVDGVNAWDINAVVDGSVLNANTFAGTFPWVAASSVCYIAGRFVVNCPVYPGRFAWSTLNRVPGTAWDALDYATAESNPDPLVAVWESRGELVLFGTATTEFWAPSSGVEVFARVGGSGVDWGLGAPQSVAKYNDGLIFVGRNRLGDLQVAMMRGYQAQVISTPDIDFNINNDANPTGATAYTFTQSGHSFYVLNLSDKTWVFNITTGEWDEWQTAGGKFCGRLGIAAFGKYLVADYRDTRVYYLDDETYTDGTDAVVREITSKHFSVDLDRFTVWEMIIDAEMGAGLVSGQGTNPQVMLQVSRDNGHTFGNELWVTLGKMGDYLARAVWRRLGRGRDFVVRLRIADPVKVVITNASMRLEK